VPTLFQPDAVWKDGRVYAGTTLAVGDDGRVLAAAPPSATAVRLRGQVLLPGLVNAHSHAFQRVLRGRTEFVEKGNASDDFWSWREAMYRAATQLSPDGVYVASRQAFVEMALAGITTVGEFHYLHHQADGTPYADVHQLARQVIRAAREVGLRICLLRVAYARAGFKKDATPRQRRFCDATAEEALSRTASLRDAYRMDPLVTVGLAPHSVRAVPRAWLELFAKEGGRALQGAVVHAHAAEQPAEIDQCKAEHALRPVELFDAVGLLDARTTLVHGVHLGKGEPELLAKAQATVCACPTTERNLGDGVVPADTLRAAGVAIAFGSDSQAQIDLFEEGRALDGHLRLTRLRRAPLDDGSGGIDNLGAQLLRAATAGGARSLGLDTGALAVGTPADFLTVDLEHPSLIGTRLDALSAHLAFGATPACVRDVYVQGKRIVENGVHVLAQQSGRDFQKLVESLG
jgi:formimidoylglutamate deiminase